MVTAVGFAPATRIDTPPRLPFPFGLNSVVSIADAATERWTNGVTWEMSCFDPAGIAIGDCDDPQGFPREFPESGPGTGEAYAFTVYGVYKCSMIGMNLDDAQDKARDALLAREEQAAEFALWQRLAQFEDSDGNGPEELTGGDVVEVLGQLEKFIADTYGSLGVIHASRNAATTLTQKGLIRASGSRMLTNLNTPVLVGSGYPGSGPGTYTEPVGETPGSWAYDPPAAGTEFVAASPAIFGYRSQVFDGSLVPGDLLDRGTNDMIGLAERNYLLGFEPCGVAFAALTLGCC